MVAQASPAHPHRPTQSPSQPSQRLRHQGHSPAGQGCFQMPLPWRHMTISHMPSKHLTSRWSLNIHVQSCTDRQRPNKSHDVRAASSTPMTYLLDDLSLNGLTSPSISYKCCRLPKIVPRQMRLQLYKQRCGASSTPELPSRATPCGRGMLMGRTPR